MKPIDSWKTERKVQKINQEEKSLEEELIEAMSVPLTMYPSISRAQGVPSVQYSVAEKFYYSDVKIYLVGGAVREIVRGHAEKVKDWDFAIEADSFEQMRDWVLFQGFEIFVETPQYFTIRARASDAFWFAGMDMSGRTFDFTLCRTEGDYSDGRRPDKVYMSTIKEDLSRRDFTMNAIAMDSRGNLVDPFDGAQDVKSGIIRCVGSTERLREDSLRMLRAIRFAIQLDFEFSNDILGFLKNPENSDLLDNVSEERIREELTKCFKKDTLETLYYLKEFPAITEKVFSSDLWLLPTVKS